MTYIEEYYNQIKSGKVIVSHKVQVVYKKLVQDLKKPQVVHFYNESIDDYESHTYIFDEKKAHKSIEFIEGFVDTQKVNGQINQLNLSYGKRLLSKQCMVL